MIVDESIRTKSIAEILVERLKLEYPDRMVLDEIGEMEYWKLAGKIELIKEIEYLVEELQK